MRYWPPASSTSASSPSAKPRPTWPNAVSRCGCNPSRSHSSRSILVLARQQRLQTDYLYSLLTLQLRQPLLQIFQRLRVRVPDDQRTTLFACQRQGVLEGGVDGLEGALIVEKYIPRQVPHARRLGSEGSLGCRRGAAVDKEQPARSQHLHHPIHRLTVAGQAAAHMVVESLNGHKVVEVGLQGLLQLGSVHIGIQTAWPNRQRRAVFHGLMEYHCLAGDGSFTCQQLGRLRVGQDSQCHRGRQ